MDHSEVKHLPKVDYTPAELDEASQLLLKGADLIETRGHHKGSYTDGTRLCFRGALNMAASGGASAAYDLSGASDIASVRFLGRMRDRGHVLPGGWLKWNDAPERTADEVISAMRMVALGL